jgi:hypothetical protein
MTNRSIYALNVSVYKSAYKSINVEVLACSLEVWNDTNFRSSLEESSFKSCINVRVFLALGAKRRRM